MLTHVGVDFSSSDNFETVIKYYKDQMGEPTATFTTPEGKQQTTWKNSEGGYCNQIVVTELEKETAISAMKTKE